MEMPYICKIYKYLKKKMNFVVDFRQCLVAFEDPVHFSCLEY